ncbi:MAG: hypothetical protein OXI24_09780 [Candidatus Poribacteria bacterium]|nr:hypothetical protein [Candidatus Poribacteria bacterium]
MNAKKDDLSTDIADGTSLAAGVAKIRGDRPAPVKDFWERDDVEAVDDPVSEIEEALNISKSADPLAAFLDVDPAKPPTAQVRIPRLDTEVTIMAITDSRKHERMVQRCQREYKVRGQRREELDTDRLSNVLGV